MYTYVWLYGYIDVVYICGYILIPITFLFLLITTMFFWRHAGYGRLVAEFTQC